MKIYNPKLIHLIKVQIINPEIKEKYYMTFDECTLRECLDEINETINDKLSNSKNIQSLSRRTQIICREYYTARSSQKGLSKHGNGTSKSISTKFMLPVEVFQLLNEKYS